MADLDVHEILRQHEAQKAARAAQLPTEADCLAVMQQAFNRLQELGWRDAVYSPKDGTYFQAIVFGGSRPLPCTYLGDWPSGGWFVAEAGDLWPCRPSLFKMGDAHGVEGRKP